MDAYADGSFYNRLGLFAVATFLAPVNDWTRLQIRWRRVLHEADPNLDVFRMTDYMSGKVKPYSERTADNRAKLVSDLIKIISETVIYGVAGIMRPSGYKALKTMHAEGTSLLGENPYAMCADTCITFIGKRLDDIGPSQRVAYTFEAGDRGLSEWNSTVARILTSSQKYRDDMKIASVTILTKSDALALQTADIFAYECTHCDGELTENLQLLASRIPMQRVYIDDGLVQRAAAGFTPEVARELWREYSLGRQRKRRAR
jgi:hypothetical protein